MERGMARVSSCGFSPESEKISDLISILARCIATDDAFLDFYTNTVGKDTRQAAALFGNAQGLCDDPLHIGMLTPIEAPDRDWLLICPGNFNTWNSRHLDDFRDPAQSQTYYDKSIEYFIAATPEPTLLWLLFESSVVFPRGDNGERVGPRELSNVSFCPRCQIIEK